MFGFQDGSGLMERKIRKMCQKNNWVSVSHICFQRAAGWPSTMAALHCSHTASKVWQIQYNQYIPYKRVLLSEMQLICHERKAKGCESGGAFSWGFRCFRLYASYIWENWEEIYHGYRPWWKHTLPNEPFMLTVKIVKRATQGQILHRRCCIRGLSSRQAGCELTLGLVMGNHMARKPVLML